ncbi:MAG: HlyD family secretion protein [Coxiellaceae bacterium]|nr:HlyD family secretion protein [Coxiellaceae bacterium]
MFKKLMKFITITIALLALLVGGYWYYQHQKFYPSTDDAYVQANIINIAPQVSGKVEKIFVQNNQHVDKGAPLFNIDPSAFQAALNKAQANLSNTIQQVKALQASVAAAKAMVAQRQAELTNTAKQTERILTLVKQKLYAAAQGDTAIQNLKVAKANLHAANSQLKEAQQKLGASGDANAQIREAKAAVAQAEINLSYTKIVAPTSGRIAQFTLRNGSNVSAFQQLFSLVADQDWWVSANFKETDLERIRPGQKVKVVIDMYPNHVFKGRVTSISPGSGESFALLPPENASGNWVKVTQRFPVRIAIPRTSKKYPLRIGSSCTVTVDTRSIP